MEANATVIKTNNYNCCNTLDERLLEQAEVSFKAGCQEGWDKAKEELETNPEILRIAREELNEQKKAGIREVVEWGEEDCPHFPTVSMKKRQCTECWQAKKEEWGIVI